MLRLLIYKILHYMKNPFILFIFLAFFSVQTFAFASFDKNLAPGSAGPEVKNLQMFLTDQDVYSGPISGFYGKLTKKAVSDFQKKYNIKPASGYFGNLTKAQANKLTVVSKEVPSSTIVFDVCKNIEGIQTVSPVGMYADNGNCSTITVNNNQQQNYLPLPTPQQQVVPTEASGAVAMVDIKVNGSNGPVNIFNGATPTISWTSKLVQACGIVGAKGWSGNYGTLGSKVSGPISESTTVTIQCSGIQLSNGDMVGGTISDSVIVNVTNPTPPQLPIIVNLTRDASMSGINNVISPGNSKTIATFKFATENQSGTLASVTIRLSNEASLVFSNLILKDGANTVCSFINNNDGTYSCNGIQVFIPWTRIVSVLADVSSNVSFAPAPAVTVTSASIVGLIDGVTVVPSTMPVDGPNVSVN